MVSIIIPVYNAEKYLAECVDSVLAQTYRNIEVILVNDGSNDSTKTICDAYLKVDDRVKVFHQKNKGVSSARNVGIDNSRGEYITFIDADDVVDKKFIEKQLLCIQFTKADICMSEYLITLTPLSVTGKNHELNYICYSAKDILKDVLNKKISNVGATTKLIHRSLIDDLRFQEDIFIAEDMLFTIQLLGKAQKVVYLPESLYFYRQNIEESTTKRNFTKKVNTLFLAYDRMQKILSTVDVELISALENHRYRISFHVINLMILLGIPFCDKTFQTVYCEIKCNRRRILKDPVLSLKAKMGIIILVNSEKKYRKIKLFLTKKRRNRCNR